MQKLEIVLIKRNNKQILYLLAALFCVLGSLSFVSSAFLNGFSWWNAIIGSLFVFGGVFICSRLYGYYTHGEVKLIVESDGTTLVFLI